MLVIVAGVFKKNDIRGVVGRELNRNFAERIGFLFIKTLKSETIQNVAIAGDTRKSTPELVEGLITGMRKAGANVYDLGIGPTPLTYFVAAHNMLITQALMVTGSHNPPDQNGIKICNAKGQSYHYDNLFHHLEYHLEEFEEKFPNLSDLPLSGQKLDGNDLKKEYFEYLGNSVRLKNKFSVIVDYGRGATVQFGQILEKLGLDFKELGKDSNGTFDGDPPDPAKPRTFNKLKAAITNEIVAIAFDTDGDRVGFMTNSKEIISPDLVAMLFADSVKLKKDNPKIIIDVKVSKATAMYVEQIGGETLLSQVGHSYIHENLINNNADVAAELSGHYYFHDNYYGFDDGLYGAIRFLEIIDRLIDKGITLEEKLKELPVFDSTPEFRDHISYENIEKILVEAEGWVESKSGKISKIDGLRAEFDDGWFLLRKSGTEEILSYRVEGDNPESRDRILQNLQAIISKY